jgi:hypothetical protein
MTNEIKTFDKEYTYGSFDMGFQNTMKEPARAETAAQVANESKGIAEIQASYIIAKKFPRNEHQCYIAMLDSCKRPFLAESAMYAYPRGSQLVTGPSIRLAEVLAQKWTNCKIGIEILSQDKDMTEARAYANDLENNYMVDACFTVKHQRTTKKGVTKLTDERDIREMVQNIGSRHLRGCILRVIPGDIVEAAVEQCKKTLASSDVPIAEQIRKMVAAFDELGVKVEHLEKRLGHNLNATISQEIVTLKSIYKSIKDGMASREDFFDIASRKSEDARDELMQLVDKNKQEVAKTTPKAGEKKQNQSSLSDVGESQSGD